MTSVLTEDDKIFTMYRQYQDLIIKDVEKGNGFVYGVDQLAARLTVAHMLDHVVCLFKKDESPTVRKINKTWEETFDDNAEAEIMRNNFTLTGESPITTSTSTLSTNMNWGRRE